MTSKEATVYIENVRMDLRDHENIFKCSFDTIDPDEYFAQISEGIL